MISKQERQEALERQIARLQRRGNRLGASSQQNWIIKLLLLIGGGVLVILALLPSRWLGVLLLLLIIAIFVFIALNHRKVDRSYLRHQALARMKKIQLARMILNWDALPAQLELDEVDHPFEVDLDLTGERSLHRLMNTAVSFEGGSRLGQWLLRPPTDATLIRQRQEFVQELLALTGFRNTLLVHSLDATRYTDAQYDESRLLQWLKSEATKKIPRSTLYIPVLANATTLTLLVLCLLGLAQPWTVFFPLLFALTWFFATQHRYARLFEDASQMRVAFGQLGPIFGFLETYRYGKQQRLKKLCTPFIAGQRPSILLKKLSRIASVAALTQQPEARLMLNALIPLEAWNAYQFSQLKDLTREKLPQWLEAWFELEALCSVANFAYLNPDYTFPQLLETKGEALCFEARDLGHPLLPTRGKVLNDFRLETNNEIELITGSNMAGKSTFLRTMGINLCLAYAGGSVNASRLSTSLFELYACIKVSDSLADGYSYFYAEVRRLQGLLERLRQEPEIPLFFLIDEIFKGTNNDERLIGSSAYIHALVGKNCTGAISTHDLELVKLADTLPTLKNYHFREDIQDGQMVFDYKLHPGPCPTRNALKIMELAGLPVSWSGFPEGIPERGTETQSFQ